MAAAPALKRPFLVGFSNFFFWIPGPGGDPRRVPRPFGGFQDGHRARAKTAKTAIPGRIFKLFFLIPMFDRSLSKITVDFFRCDPRRGPCEPTSSLEAAPLRFFPCRHLQDIDPGSGNAAPTGGPEKASVERKFIVFSWFRPVLTLVLSS